MASSPKFGTRHPLRALTAAAACALALALAMPAGVATGQELGIDRGVIPVAPDAPERYIVQPGDTLSAIAKKVLGNANEYMDIFNANRDQLTDPDMIKPGQVLKIPQHTHR